MISHDFLFLIINDIWWMRGSVEYGVWSKNNDDSLDRMSHLTIFFDQMSYSAKCRIDQKSYATSCRIGEMVFDELSCTQSWD